MIITLWANRQFSPFPVVRNNCYFIADEVRAIPNGIFYLFEIGLLRFFVIVCFKTAFARAEMKRWDEMVSLCSIYFSLSYKTKSWISRGFYCMRLSFFWNSVNFPSNKVYVFCTRTEAWAAALHHCFLHSLSQNYSCKQEYTRGRSLQNLHLSTIVRDFWSSGSRKNLQRPCLLYPREKSIWATNGNWKKGTPCILAPSTCAKD